ncbi:hypothetical protein BGS_1087 [Beggiatoa sp. SS]|nr:hypothetical protein BGS_1087 [Beggiatoa sp. SS]
MPLDIKALGLEWQTPIKESIVLNGQGQRWTQSYEPLPWKPSLPTNRLRQQGRLFDYWRLRWNRTDFGGISCSQRAS